MTGQQQQQPQFAMNEEVITLLEITGGEMEHVIEYDDGGEERVTVRLIENNSDEAVVEFETDGEVERTTLQVGIE